ncbi:MAG: N-6 DNA methylase [Ktedonobacteraceae bacterium]
MIGNRREQAEGQPAAVEEPGTIFINRNLFSSYYLGTLLAREVRTRLGETGTRIPISTRRRLQSQWDRVAPMLGDSTPYTRTRQAWIEPLLRILGYEPLEEARAADFGEDALPDGYFLYRPVAAAAEQARETDEAPPAAPSAASGAGSDDIDDQHDPTVVLLSLLSWGTDFDRPFAALRRRADMPHKLMERLLAAGAAQWGLLCNGRRLRLLRRNVVAGRQQYFEVDLETLFEDGTDRDFDTFWTLFRAQAFQPDDKGRCLLDVVDEGSRKHAEGVSATLKGSVFRAIETLMRTLVSRAQGITRRPVDPVNAAEQRLREQAETALNDLPLLYQQSLLLLYRLLFVLYAESRTLLPVDNAVYRDSYSLEPLRDEITEADARYLPGAFRLWETMQSLFRLIHQGCATTQLVVPAYNGDLFNPRLTDLLNAMRVPDDALAEVLRELSVTPPTRERGRERIDYQDLGVEQLGAVYEGLLEYEPKVAAEPMVEVRYKGDSAVIPAREQREYTIVRAFETGQFYLGHGAGRKTSGSYYTPQPLVDFIVRRTLGPLVQNRTAEQILDLKVVDPAMGSGAFLVGACLFLADAYARALRREQSPIEQSGAEIGEIEELEGEQDDLSEEATRPYRRLVAERCLYGVDLNPMAVELAKVSLWLTTLAGDKPLTFLDANLRCGNSLIGAPLRPYTLASGREQTIDTIHPAANKRLLKARGAKALRGSKGEDDGYQLALFAETDIPQALEPLVGRRQWIAETPSDSVARVHEKATLFRRQVEQDERRRMLKTICDLWIASWFWRQPPAGTPTDNTDWPPPLDGQIYRELVLQLRGEGRQLTTLDPAPYLREVERITEQVRPFHWELEFPELYFTPDGQPRPHAGFDAVIANPPWDIIKPNSREFFSAYDPGFRELERVAAEQRQEELLQDAEIRAVWDAYVRLIDDQVDFTRLSEIYPYQSVEVNGSKTGGDANTYKLFLERAYQILTNHGKAGQIVKAGIYKDEGATGLRQLLLERNSFDFLYALSNEKRVFPSVHHAERFALVGFTKSGEKADIQISFAITTREAIKPEYLPEYLTESDQVMHVPQTLVERFSPDTLSIMEFRSQRDVDIVEHIYGDWPLLGGKIDGAWSIALSREFDMTNDRYLFNENSIGWPLYEGKMMHQYTHQFAEPRYWVDPTKGQEELARRAIQHVEEALDALLPARLKNTTRQQRIAALLKAHRRGPLTADDVRTDAEAPRLVFRRVASSTNERTLIASVLPLKVFVGNTVTYLIPWYFNSQKGLENLYEMQACYQPALPASILMYLCGILNSFTLDYTIRFKVSADVSMFYIYQLPVPRLTPNDQCCRAIAERVARLVCVGPEFDELQRELLGSVEARVATNHIERQKLQNEIDALVAYLYGLSEDELRHILYAPYTFPLIRREVKDGVMAAFGRVEEMIGEA